MDLAQLKPKELDAHVANRTFRFSFIGMSNAGKSYRSKTLEKEMGFLWYQVDEEIQKGLGLESMGQISSWLGFPTSENYGKNEKKYLELENKFTCQAAMRTGGKNLVFDTTGSIIHLNPDALGILKENCLVVHLDVGEESIEQMVEKFFLEPKPVAWSGYFNINPGETEREALKRCYPRLLHDRLKKYRKLAHINVPAINFHDKSGEETLNIIKEYLGT